MHLLIPDLAADRLAQRRADAEEARCREVLRGETASGWRRAVAVVLLAVSRASAAAVHRLDDCVAEDLARAGHAPDRA